MGTTLTIVGQWVCDVSGRLYGLNGLSVQLKGTRK